MKNNYFRLAYVPELDGLRGIAIIFVMLFHFEFPFFEGGFIGVDVFFVLSGFLITSLLIQEFDRIDHINLRYFYVRRVLRLGPALICLLVIFCCISFMVLDREEAIDNLIDALISLIYFSNWARAFMLHPPDFVGHTWSLSIEEQFYILWPISLLILLRLIKDRRYIAITTFVIALCAWCLRAYLAVNQTPVERLYNGLDTRADALMIGCALGVLVSSKLISENIKKRLSKLLIIIAPFSMMGLFAFAIFGRWQGPVMYLYGFFMVEIFTAVLIIDCLIVNQSIIRRFLKIKWLVWIGSVSYGLYLWHYPIYRMLSAMGFSPFIVIVIGILMTFAIAACSYYLLEKPILKFKEGFLGVVSTKSC